MVLNLKQTQQAVSSPLATSMHQRRSILSNRKVSPPPHAKKGKYITEPLTLKHLNHYSPLK